MISWLDLLLLGLAAACARVGLGLLRLRRRPKRDGLPIRAAPRVVDLTGRARRVLEARAARRRKRHVEAK